MYTYTTARALQEHRFEAEAPAEAHVARSIDSGQPRFAWLMARFRVISPIAARPAHKTPVAR